jgi:NAD(P)-dependent dehydrogenase (short-subunit alcohol dehydrogenase family)
VLIMGVAQLFRLDGQVALVTGGSRGLGLQMRQILRFRRRHTPIPDVTQPIGPLLYRRPLRKLLLHHLAARGGCAARGLCVERGLGAGAAVWAAAAPVMAARAARATPAL